MHNTQLKRIISLIMLSLILVLGILPTNVVGQDAHLIKSISTEEIGNSLSLDQINAYLRLRESEANGGLIGFPESFNFDDNSDTSVIVEFQSKPVKVAKVVSEVNRSARFSLQSAKQNVDDDYNIFMEELLGIFGSGGGIGLLSQENFSIESRYTEAINGLSISLPKDKIKELANISSVKAVYPNLPTYLLPVENKSNWMESSSQDTFKGFSDGPESVGMKESRDYLNVGELHSRGICGEGVVVGVLDTGVDYNHPDLVDAFGSGPKDSQGRPILSEEELIDGIFYGRNFDNDAVRKNSNDPMETTYDDWVKVSEKYPEFDADGISFYTSHGTHVSGTIAARGENDGLSTLGIAPKSTLISYRVLGPYGSGSTVAVLDALDHVVADGCDVVNMSLGVDTSDPNYITNKAVNNLVLAHDLVFSVASGNSGPGLFTSGSPAAASSVIAVGNGSMGQKDVFVTVEAGSEEFDLVAMYYDNDSEILPIDNTGLYKLDFENLEINEDDSYDIVYIEDSGNELLYKEAFMNANDEYGLKGKIVLVDRGVAFLDTIKLAQEYEIGAVILRHRELDNGGDFETISFFRGRGNYLPFFSMDLEPGDAFYDTLINNEGSLKIVGTEASPAHVLHSSSSVGPIMKSFEIKPDIIAPGDMILSTVPYYHIDPSATGGERYTNAADYMTGTSMAAPHIAGLAALLLGENPNLTSPEIKSRMMNTATELNDNKGVYQVGAGFVNPLRMLDAESYITVDYDGFYIYEEDMDEIDILSSGEVGSISFGMHIVDSGEMDDNIRQVNIYNQSNSQKTYNLRAKFSEDSQGTEVKNNKKLELNIYSDPLGSIATDSISIDANSSGSLWVEITGTGDLVEDDVGIYDGYVDVMEDVNEYRIPFAMYAMSAGDAVIDTYFNKPVISGYYPDTQSLSSIVADFHFTVNYKVPEVYLLIHEVNEDGSTGKLIGETGTPYEIPASVNIGDKVILKEAISISYVGYEYDDSEEYIVSTFDGILDPGHYHVLTYVYDGPVGNQFGKETMDLYVDGSAPQLTIENYDPDTKIFTGRVYDQGIEEMEGNGILFRELEDNQLPNQGFNAVFAGLYDQAKGGYEYIRADVDQDGYFELTLSGDINLTDDIKIYALDNFTPSKFAKEETTSISEGFDPEGISFKEKISDDIYLGYYGVNKLELTVNPEEYIDEALMISGDTDLLMHVGEEKVIKPYLNKGAVEKGYRDIKFVSSDTDILEVDGGKLFAKATGHASITASSQNHEGGQIITNYKVVIDEDYSDGVNYYENDRIYFGKFGHLLDVVKTNEMGVVPRYYEGEEGSKTPVLWKVMGEEKLNEEEGDGYLTLLSDYIIDTKVFGSKNSHWIDSDMREFLNEEFINGFETIEENMVPYFKVATSLYNYEEEISPLGFNTIIENQRAYLPWKINHQEHPDTPSLFRDSVFWSASDKIIDDNAIISYESYDYSSLKSATKVTDIDLGYFLRSYSDYYHADWVEDNGMTDRFGIYASLHGGLRPVTKITPYSVLYKSLVVDNPELGETEPLQIGGIGRVYDEGKGQIDNYKLVIAAEDDNYILSYDNLSINENEIIIEGIETEILGDRSDLKIAYKLVGTIGGARDILRYGELDIGDSSQNLHINSSNLDGDYKLYMWIQKDNQFYSHEALSILVDEIEIGNENPIVLDFEPKGDSVSVHTRKISASFSRPMNSAIEGKIYISNDHGENYELILGQQQWSEDDTRVTVEIDDYEFQYGVKYKVRIEGFEDLGGQTNTVEDNYEFTIESEPDTIIPTIVSVEPSENVTTNFPRFEVEFSEAMLPNEGHIMFLGEKITARSWNSDMNVTLYTIFGELLDFDTEYSFEIVGFKDLAGNEIEPFIHKFTTEGLPYVESVSPMGDDVSINTEKMEIQFHTNNGMDDGVDAPGWVKLNGEELLGARNWVDSKDITEYPQMDTLIIDIPNSMLQANTEYNVEIAEFRDGYFNPITPYFYSFTTGSEEEILEPEIVSVEPLENVATSSPSFTIEFSVAMESSKGKIVFEGEEYDGFWEDDRTLSFTVPYFVVLEMDTEYTLEFKDFEDKEGNLLNPNPTFIDFRTEGYAHVIDISPEGNNVSIDTEEIVAQFFTNVGMNDSEGAPGFVSINGRELEFDWTVSGAVPWDGADILKAAIPEGFLEYDTVYTVIISDFEDGYSNPADYYQYQFRTEEEILEPEIVSVEPLENVATSSPSFTIEFSVAMESSKGKIVFEGEEYDGFWEDDRTLSFTAPYFVVLDMDTDYTLEFKDFEDKEGNLLNPNPTFIDFRTEGYAHVIDISPEGNNVSIDTEEIVAQFFTNVGMNDSEGAPGFVSINGRELEFDWTVSGAVPWDGADILKAAIPEGFLEYDTVYTVIISDFEDGYSNPADYYQYQFKTEEEGIGEVIDKTELEKQVNKVKDYNPEDFIDGWDDFEQALNIAMLVLEDEEASQEEVDKALRNLIAAEANLVRGSGLESLTTSVGQLRPGFASDQYDYSMALENRVSSIDIHPVAANPNSEITISVNGKVIDDNSIRLKVGLNIVEIEVVDDYGSIEIYSIKITRKYVEDGNEAGGEDIEKPEDIDKMEPDNIYIKESKGGKVSASAQYVKKGEKIIITVIPDEGYDLEELLILDQKGNKMNFLDMGGGTYSYTHKAGNISVEALFKKIDEVGNGIDSLLIVDQDIAFMQGSEQGYFNPDINITRAEVAQVFYNLLKDKKLPVAESFVDVAETAWYYDAVTTLTELGIINGIGDNRFAPDRNITRQEFIAIATRFTNIEDIAAINIFEDVSAADWGYTNILAGLKFGWIDGYVDGTFKPHNYIKRAEVVKIVNAMLGRRVDEDLIDDNIDTFKLFKDVGKEHWAFYEIVAATNSYN